MEKHPLHLKDPELQKSEDVKKAVEKKERLEDIVLPNDPKDRIEAYLDRLEKIFLNPDQRVKERNLELLLPSIYDTLIIKPEQVPESYFELQQQVARERGQTVETIPQDVRDQMIETVISDQKHSLDQWIEYLTSDDVAYPTWFKYFVWRNVIKLSQFDKTLGKFKTRTESTVAPYPDIYRAPLARILDTYEEALKDKTKSNKEVQEDFSKRFAKLYAELITESLSVTIENKEQIKGEWIKYYKGNQAEADKLFDSMQAKGTGWCVEGRTTARNYVEQGDFYVFYTYNQNNEPSQPRIAIQMNGNQIGQIRGIQAHQELEPVMVDVLEDKLKEFGPEADSYKKKNADMRRMTEIEKKTKSKEELSKDDLLFLYEIDSKIEGFGYDRDPRIAELRSKRDPKLDAPIVLECQPEQIATNISEITEKTKAYLGSLEPGVFNKLRDIEKIYTQFPDKPIEYRKIVPNLELKTADDYRKALDKEGFKIEESYAGYILDRMPEEEKRPLDVVILSVSDLGFPRGATTEQIYERAKKLGLELCPAWVGPELRISYKDQPQGDWFRIGMEQISGAHGYPNVFDVGHYTDSLWLSADYALPQHEWHDSHRWAFVLPHK
jgi:hypothetical protein